MPKHSEVKYEQKHKFHLEKPERQGEMNCVFK